MSIVLPLFILFFFLFSPAVVLADDGEKEGRLTFGVPLYVYHPDDRPGPEGWNEGWLNNEGLFIDASWSVYRLGASTGLRAGIIGGAFDNSMHDFSAFIGGMAEIETRMNRWSLAAGTYAGGITGYDQSPAPAIAPYVGVSFAVTERTEIGARGFWLPAKTIAGESLAPSDAFVTGVTVSRRF